MNKEIKEDIQSAKKEKAKFAVLMDDATALRPKKQIEDARVLNSRKVSGIFDEVLKLSEEWVKNNDTSDLPEDFVIPGTVSVHGITLQCFFDKSVIEKYDKEIKDMLNELPDSFRLNGGGGYSFQQACYDKHGNHWGEHHDMQILFMLGMAASYVRCPFPRSLWRILPGGMPYYVIDTTGEWKDHIKVIEEAYPLFQDNDEKAGR